MSDKGRQKKDSRNKDKKNQRAREAENERVQGPVRRSRRRTLLT